MKHQAVLQVLKPPVLCEPRFEDAVGRVLFPTPEKRLTYLSACLHVICRANMHGVYLHFEGAFFAKWSQQESLMLSLKLCTRDHSPCFHKNVTCTRSHSRRDRHSCYKLVELDPGNPGSSHSGSRDDRDHPVHTLFLACTGREDAYHFPTLT